MIEFTKGDMFAVGVDARVNTVNCVGVMGAGVALAFKSRYPEMFEEYVRECREGHIRPGALHIWRGPTGERVINFPTKRDWKDPSRYEDISSGLEALKAYLAGQGPITVALPALGCGHGGLDWAKVSAMIKESLSDLEARILVFEPADSRNAGRLARNPTAQELEEMEALGFRSLPRPFQSESNAPSTPILSKGDSSLLKRPWIALLTSREPTARETEALNAVAHQMTSSAADSVIALVHATRATERIAKVFLENGVAVVLILPFGPLARKSVSRASIEHQKAPFLMASVTEPNEQWSRATFAQSMRVLSDRAFSVLLSDPAPDWLSEKIANNWKERPVFYLRYAKQSNSARQILDRFGARPIGRRPDTREPNLAPLFGDDQIKEKRERAKSDTGSEPQANVPPDSRAKEKTPILFPDDLPPRSAPTAAFPALRTAYRGITEFTRKDIIDSLLSDKEQPFHGALDLIGFLKKIWPLESMPSEDSRFKNAAGDIWQHMINNYDYDEAYLLYERLHIVDLSDRQFARFLETCIAPSVARDPERIEKLAEIFNKFLVQDGFEVRVSGVISGRSIYKVVDRTSGSEFAGAYEVVLSFAGEDRAYVEQVARSLKQQGITFFYDDYEEASLWGKDLHEHLYKVYSGPARYCVMFISKHYAKKVWPTHERRSAFEKAIETREEYILPARFDSTQIPGLHRTIKYVDLKLKTPQELADLICQKLGRTEVYRRPETARSVLDPVVADDSIPF